MKIVILGPTGSGKSTQSEFISKLLKIKHINLGERFREIAKKNKYIKKFVSEGRLVPNKITLKLIKNLTNKEDYVLDGFPRDITQAKSFKEKIDLVIFLKASKKKILERLSIRKREDDTLEDIERKYHIYLKQTLPVVKYYKNKKILATVNGTSKEKIVNEKIRKILIRYQQQQ